MTAKVVLTGIKPTGSPHLGNYLGAIRPALRLAEDEECSALYFIADHHALTLVQDRERLKQLTYEVAAAWLALGLDPTRTLFYRQSDVPEIFELSWILSCFTPKGWMNKAHAYKAILAEHETAGLADMDAGVNMGVYSYPILMAADILLFETDIVPVGKDQHQHVEIARDIAQRFNHVYGSELLRVPVAATSTETAVVPGIDGRKMSKSHGNTIPLFASAAKLKRQVGRIVTDSAPPEAPKVPDSSILFQIYEQFATPGEVDGFRARYLEGISWGEAKARLFEVLDRILSVPRQRYDDLMAHPSRIDDLLDEGGASARARARPVLERVRAAVGIGRR